MTERIRVSGFRPPLVFLERGHRARAVAPIRLINLFGLLTAAIVVIAVLAWRTPHMLLFSRSSGYGAYRLFDDCAYASLDGRVVHLRGGSCPQFRLLHERL